VTTHLFVRYDLESIVRDGLILRKGCTRSTEKLGLEPSLFDRLGGKKRRKGAQRLIEASALASRGHLVVRMRCSRSSAKMEEGHPRLLRVSRLAFARQ
jgi:hypothetical protein